VSTSDSLVALRAELGQFIDARFGSDTANDLIREAVLAEPALASLDRAELTAALNDVLAGRHRPRLLVDWGELPQVGRALHSNRAGDDRPADREGGHRSQPRQ
jgi:hypothetical protein